MIRERILLMHNISSAPFLSGYTYRSMASQAICDVSDTEHMRNVSHGIRAKNVKNGDILYVTGNQAKRFFRDVAVNIGVEFSVVTAQWDFGPDSSFMQLIPENLTTWWTINCHIDHPKVKSIPLGLQNLHWRWEGNIQSSPSTYKKFRGQDKTKFMIGSFSVDNNPSERIKCVEAAKIAGSDFRMFQRRDRQNENYVLDYFNQVSQYKFVLCPWGAGIDTHRLWESLYLGSIPITRYHKVYEAFKDYPVVFLDDWSELKDLDFEDIYHRNKQKLETENRIYFDYWNNKIKGL